MRARHLRRGYSLLDVTLGTFVLAMGVMTFSAIYPEAARASRMNGAYSQALSEAQHKVDQLRSVGYGRLNFTDLRAAGIIDATPTTSPFHFGATDGLVNVLPGGVGTITTSSAGTDLTQVVIHIQWRRGSSTSVLSSHDVTMLVANQ